MIGQFPSKQVKTSQNNDLKTLLLVLSFYSNFSLRINSLVEGEGVVQQSRV